MLKIMLVGYGNMGQRIEASIQASNDMEVVHIVKETTPPNIEQLPLVDAIIDFSHPNHLDWICEYITSHPCSYICGTTNHSEQQKQQIQELSKIVPVVFQANFSLGVEVIKQVVKMITPLLENHFDMEIVETHHNQKQDAPSGTAKLLLETMDPNHQYEHVFGRSGFVGKRKKEIGIHALRGGSVAGEHSVFYFGDEESIEIKHSANSRKIFVNGALQATRFACKKQPGMYTMQDILFTK